MVRSLITLLVTISLIAWVLRQTSKPSGPIGAGFARLMNRTHSRLTDWGLGHLLVRPTDIVLDVGCGGGRTVQKLAALAHDGTVYGVDYAAASVRTARRVNADALANGHVQIEQASVAALPFP